MNKKNNESDEDVDALFKLPLAEFTDARNALAARLKKSGRGDEALEVKALGKPPVSAWVVNQLYWNHRKAFDQLIASGERFHKAQKSGKVADMREALEARRESLSRLSETAATVLSNAGHNPSLDIVRRVNATLEAMTVFARRPDAPHPGRLTHDVDPPGFESFASFTPSAGTTKSTKQPVRITPPQKSTSALTNTRSKKEADNELLRVAESRKKGIAAAKVAVQDAKSALADARARVKSLETAQKKAEGEVKKTETHRRAVEEELRKAKAAAETAVLHARSVDAEVKVAAKAVNDAERAVNKATGDLESLLGN